MPVETTPVNLTLAPIRVSPLALSATVPAIVYLLCALAFLKHKSIKTTRRYCRKIFGLGVTTKIEKKTINTSTPNVKTLLGLSVLGNK